MLIYKYPGDMIEYLDGKRYDIKTVEPYELEDHLLEGWHLTTEDAEGKKIKKAKKQDDHKDLDDAGL